MKKNDDTFGSINNFFDSFNLNSLRGRGRKDLHFYD